MRSSERVRVARVSAGTTAWVSDAVAVEAPLQVHVRHGDGITMLGATMRTPGHDVELAVGLAVAEGVVRNRHDVAEVRHCSGNARYSENDVLVALQPGATVQADLLGRVSSPSSACGMCGRDRIDALLASVPSLAAGPEVRWDVIAGLPSAMSARQAVFRRTGGLHAAGLADAGGRMLIVREDVGRHNAVDKVVGAALLEEVHGDVLVVSSRVGFEIVQKAAMAAVPVLVAVSAPTSLAVDAAREAGLTLVAFVREGRLGVYSGHDRIGGQEAVGA